MQLIDFYLFKIQTEGLVDAMKCKAARVSVNQQTKNYLDPLKSRLKQCKQITDKNERTACIDWHTKKIEQTQKYVDKAKGDVKKYCN